MITHTERIRIQWVDTDASGRIHYTAALRFFERTEHALFLRLCDGKMPQELGIPNLPRVHVELDMMAELGLNDELDCTARVAKIGNSSITYGFEAVRLDETPCLAGQIVAVAMDDAGQSMHLPGNFRAILEGAL